MEIIAEKWSGGKRPRTHRGKGYVALLLILGGILLLCTKLNIIPVKYINVLISWQSLVIFFGLVALFKKRFYSAVIFLSVGIFFIIPEIAKVPNHFLGYIPENFTQLYWPVLLIIAGLLFLFNWIFPSSCRSHKWERFERYHNHEKARKFESNNGFVNAETAFQSTENIVLEPEFKGGQVKSAFGETIFDLRKTNLKEGNTVLEIDIAFGSATIYVPADWNVQLNVSAVFGGFVDKRVDKSYNPENTKVLTISGNCVFGGGELRN
jgi:predicted membrane protein